MADGKYEIEVDPRVEWAMKVMDQEGVDFESEVTKINRNVDLWCR